MRVKETRALEASVRFQRVLQREMQIGKDGVNFYDEGSSQLELLENEQATAKEAYISEQRYCELADQEYSKFMGTLRDLRWFLRNNGFSNDPDDIEVSIAISVQVLENARREIETTRSMIAIPDLPSDSPQLLAKKEDLRRLLVKQEEAFQADQHSFNNISEKARTCIIMEDQVKARRKKTIDADNNVLRAEDTFKRATSSLKKFQSYFNSQIKTAKLILDDPRRIKEINAAKVHNDEAQASLKEAQELARP